MSRYTEMRDAVEDANTTLRAADRCANDLAYLLRGRLRHVSGTNLEALKRELKNFNMHTYLWKA